MSFQFESPTVPVEVRRMARERLDDAVEALTEAARGHDLHDNVHRARKRAKHVRALTRLIRGSAPRVHGDVNTRVRDAARLVSDLRDSQALIETVDDLEDDEAVGDVAAVRERLAARRDALAADATPAVEEALTLLVEVRAGVGHWELPADGVDALLGGFAKTYGRCRKRLDEVRQAPSTDALHEWRKRVKYHRYHVRVLEPVWAAALGTREDELHTLTDLLGDDHDLAVLRGVLEEDPVIDRPAARTITGVLDRRRAELQQAALPLGARLFALRPDAMVAQLQTWWQAWHTEVHHRDLPPPRALAPAT